jgi:hypothetical protein
MGNLNPFDYNNNPTDEMIRQMNQLREEFKNLWNLIDTFDGDPRYKAMAKSELEKASMFANKAITHKSR